MTLLPSPKLKIKTDNKSLGDKCSLRRLLVKESKLEPLRVLDLYAGEGRIWTELRRTPLVLDEYNAPLKVEKYTPIDSAARQAGQIKAKIAPRLIAALNGDDTIASYTGEGLKRYNCIDVDTFGDPFQIWHEILFRIKSPTIVFLTRGRVTYGAGKMPLTKFAQELMGMPREWDIPVRVELLQLADRSCLLEDCPTAEIIRLSNKFTACRLLRRLCFTERTGK